MDNGSVVSEYLTIMVALGRKAGPFNQQPFPTYIGLPMGIVIKKHSDSVKYHIIHDLSWPPGASVNDHINPDLHCCIYASFNQAISLIKKEGLDTFMAKLDPMLSSTFWCIPRTGCFYAVPGTPSIQMAWSLDSFISICSCPLAYAAPLLFLTNMLTC